MVGVTNTIRDRMLERMRVTAVIPDELAKEVQKFAKGKNLSESIVRALKEWTDLQTIRELTERVKKHPLKFQPGFSAESVRALNRRDP